MRAVILLFCLVVGIEAKAQREVVQSFANNLSSWAETNSFTYLEALSRLYNSSGSRGFKTIVSDDIAKGLAVKYNVGKNESYEMDTYINWLQKEIDKGITIRISDIQMDIDNKKLLVTVKGYTDESYRQKEKDIEGLQAQINEKQAYINTLNENYKENEKEIMEQNEAINELVGELNNITDRDFSILSKPYTFAFEDTEYSWSICYDMLKTLDVFADSQDV